MEGIDEHLLVADIEVFSWKDQLKQVVSQLLSYSVLFRDLPKPF